MNKFSIETQQLSIKIGHKIICHELNLQVNPGDIWGVLGPNGSGKTTFLHTLAGLRLPTSGTILLQEKNLLSLASKSIARELGILLQDTHPVFPQGVFEYCLTGRYPHLSTFSWEKTVDRDIAKQALIAMELDGLAQQSTFNLSGGERRRLAIATLLTQSPNIYLLDEPTNHLDLRHQIKVLNHFKNLSAKNDATILMALHDINLAQYYCNKILMLFANGDFIQGNSEEILTEKNLSELYQHPLQVIEIAGKLRWFPCT